MKKIYKVYNDMLNVEVATFEKYEDAERLAELYDELSSTTNAEDRKFISQQIKDMVDEQNKTLLENEILDSMAFIELISCLEDEFDIEIQPTQVKPDIYPSKHFYFSEKNLSPANPFPTFPYRVADKP